MRVNKDSEDKMLNNVHTPFITKLVCSTCNNIILPVTGNASLSNYFLFVIFMQLGLPNKLSYIT